MIQIKLSQEIEYKHKTYFKKNILPNIKASKNQSYKYNLNDARRINVDICFFKKKFIKQHNHFIGFIKNHYETFAIGKPLELKELNEKIEELFPMISKMIRLKPDGSKKDSYNSYLYNMFGYEKFKVKDLLYYIKKKALKNVKKKQYCAKVQKEIIRILSTNYPKERKNIEKYLLPKGKNLSISEFKRNFKQLQGINITMDNFKQIDIFGEEWSDYAFIMESGVRVCPYCNRQYIIPIYSDNGKMRADIDHFLPKSRYPYFSMSLYNLVPVCKSCNQSLKRDKEFEFNSINPYNENLSDYFKFKVDIIKNEISIEKLGNKLKEITYHIDTFKIEVLYNYHKNQIQELIKKRIAYPDSYIKKIYDDNQEYFKNEQEVKQLIIGYIEDKSKLNDEAFLKLRRDVAEQLGFIDNKQNNKQIKQLKKILANK